MKHHLTLINCTLLSKLISWRHGDLNTRTGLMNQIADSYRILWESALPRNNPTLPRLHCGIQKPDYAETTAIPSG